jgi:salicylate hydroxylase
MVLLGDSVHATLPYLASGAGMSFEDGAVLGHCLTGITKSAMKERRKALEVYQSCRMKRTNRIVEKGNIQQDINHYDDGPEQSDRDQKMKAFEKLYEQDQRGESLEWGDLKRGEDPLVWRKFGAGEWLLSYLPKEDVEKRRQAGGFAAQEGGIDSARL